MKNNTIPLTSELPLNLQIVAVQNRQITIPDGNVFFFMLVVNDWLVVRLEFSPTINPGFEAQDHRYPNGRGQFLLKIRMLLPEPFGVSRRIVPSLSTSCCALF